MEIILVEVAYRFWEFLKTVASKVEILQRGALGEPVRNVPYLIMGQFEAMKIRYISIMSTLDLRRPPAQSPRPTTHYHTGIPLNVSFQNFYNLIRHLLNGLVAEIYCQFQFDSLAHSLAASQGLLDPKSRLLHRIAEKTDGILSRQYGWHFFERLPRGPFIPDRVVVIGGVMAFRTLAGVRTINRDLLPGIEGQCLSAKSIDSLSSFIPSIVVAG